MPKNITISPDFHQVVIDGELLKYILADEPVVEKIHDGAYKVTFATYAQEVFYNPALNVVDEYGETITADSDPFFDQDCPDFVYEDDEEAVKLADGQISADIEERFGDLAYQVNEVVKLPTKGCNCYPGAEPGREGHHYYCSDSPRNASKEVE